MPIDIKDFEKYASEGSGIQLEKSGEDQPEKLKATYHWWDHVVHFFSKIFGADNKSTVGNREVMDHFFSALRQAHGSEISNMLKEGLQDKYNAGTPLSSRKVLSIIKEGENLHSADPTLITIRHIQNEVSTLPDGKVDYDLYNNICHEVGVDAAFDSSWVSPETREGKKLWGEIFSRIRRYAQDHQTGMTKENGDAIVKAYITHAMAEKLLALDDSQLAGRLGDLSDEMLTNIGQMAGKDDQKKLILGEMQKRLEDTQSDVNHAIDRMRSAEPKQVAEELLDITRSLSKMSYRHKKFCTAAPTLAAGPGDPATLLGQAVTGQGDQNKKALYDRLTSPEIRSLFNVIATIVVERNFLDGDPEVPGYFQEVWINYDHLLKSTYNPDGSMNAPRFEPEVDEMIDRLSKETPAGVKDTLRDVYGVNIENTGMVKFDPETTEAIYYSTYMD